jgi:hypothetical protein
VVEDDDEDVVDPAALEVVVVVDPAALEVVDPAALDVVDPAAVDDVVGVKGVQPGRVKVPS